MFYYISGKVAVTEGSLVVIDAGGVGYAVNTSYTSARSVRVGDTATFYTYLHVREELMELYGFARREELSCFKQLIAISGVGKKLAQRILLELKDKMSREQLESAGGAGLELSAPAGEGSQALNDALEALAVLGYPRAAAAAALRGVKTEGMSTDEIVRAALKRLF